MQYSVKSMTNYANILFHAASKLTKITFFFQPGPIMLNIISLAFNIQDCPVIFYIPSARLKKFY